ncbi:MAG: hypothetical protein JSV82_06950 [Planctomycetota bacterium]|nr:MAG: hypothetical protein JSV82_06950 [Planctomycetota bacterium]
MFTIDLLKGHGIPVKGRPEGTVITVASFAVPIIIAIVMFGFYLSNKIVISVQKQEIANYEANMGKLSAAIKLQESFEKETSIINNCLSEVSSSINRHTQWSQILVILAETMPDSLVLTGLKVKQDSVRKKVPQKNDPKKMVDISVPVRTLQMSVSGNPRFNCDKAIRDFKDGLRLSDMLGPKLENIKVSQKAETLKDKDVISYEINCIFKPVL